MEGCMREAVQRDGKCFDRIIMGILRDEWIGCKISEYIQYYVCSMQEI